MCAILGARSRPTKNARSSHGTRRHFCSRGSTHLPREIKAAHTAPHVKVPRASLVAGNGADPRHPTVAEISVPVRCRAGGWYSPSHFPKMALTKCHLSLSVRDSYSSRSTLVLSVLPVSIAHTEGNETKAAKQDAPVLPIAVNYVQLTWCRTSYSRCLRNPSSLTDAESNVFDGAQAVTRLSADL